MSVALVCIGLLGLLVFGLGMAVSLTRGNTNQGFGYKPDPGDRLHKLVRAHGNTTEYAPMLALLIFVLGAWDPSVWVLGCMVLATLSRYSLAAGMLLSPTLEHPHPLRYAGALGTYLFGILLCGALLTHV